MKVSENISLREFNSFGVEARAARLVEWETSGELTEIFGGAVLGSPPSEGWQAQPDGVVGRNWMALGGGNNILFTKDFDGTLIKSAAKNIEVLANHPVCFAATPPQEGNRPSRPDGPPSTGEDLTYIRAEAGVDWGEFTAWCVARGLWGVENLSGIPGTVGAAPIQNIGAYGAEVKDVIASVECFVVETGNFLTLAAEHCAFGYRDSVFKRALRGKVIVTAVNFILSKVPRPNLTYTALAEKVTGETDLAAIARAVVEIRNSKLPDPHKTGNAGSFFKNPVVDSVTAQKLAEQYPSMPLYPAAGPEKTKLAAGWLIEQTGWKGRTEGRVGIHPQQALIVVNLGGATGREIADFAHRVQAGVRDKFGVELETEVNIIE